MTALLTLTVVVAMAASWAVTARVRRFALDRAILDVPNGRSLHTTPTPRGGGVVICGIVLCGVAGAALIGMVPAATAAGLVGGGVLVAGAGWVDDRRGLSAAVRAVIHTIAAAWTVSWLGGMPALRTGEGAVVLGWGGAVLAVIGIVWAINLYNFMDGIDGIAAAQALCAGAVGGALLILAHRPGLAAAALLTAAASAGFLVWNWSPAKIFMGDVGSGFLGYLFGALAVASENAGGVPLLVWLLLLGVFAADGSVTLLRRAAAREAFYKPHREHAYQRAVRAGWSHARVTSTVIALNLALGALAFAAMRWPARLPAVLLCGALLLALAYAGVERMLPMFRGDPADGAPDGRA